MNGWYKTSDGIKHKVDATEYIVLNNMGIIELVLPDGIKKVYCWNNNLTELDLPDSVEWINCRANKITELICPDNCGVNCDNMCKVITRTMYNRSNRLKNILK